MARRGIGEEAEVSGAMVVDDMEVCMAVGALHVEVSGALVEEAWFRRCRRVYGKQERREVMKRGSDRCVEEASCIGRRTRTEEGLEVGWQMEHCMWK
jgi:hypothetical protein